MCNAASCWKYTKRNKLWLFLPLLSWNFSSFDKGLWSNLLPGFMILVHHRRDSQENGSCLHLRYSFSRSKRRLERSMIHLPYQNAKMSFSESVPLLLLWWRHRSRALFDLTNFEGLRLTALQHNGTSAGKIHPSIKSTQTPNPKANKSRLLDVWYCAIYSCNIHQDRRERRQFS